MMLPPYFRIFENLKNIMYSLNFSINKNSILLISGFLIIWEKFGYPLISRFFKIKKNLEPPLFYFYEILIEPYQVAVLPQNTYETIQFTLEIQNRNDYAPQFPRSLAQISIPESYPVGAHFEITDLAATDGDFLDQEELNYKLIPADLFRVEIDGGRLFLVPTQQLDRETTSFLKGKNWCNKQERCLKR